MTLSGNESSTLGWIRLARAPGIGPGTGHALLREFGSPAAIFGASDRELMRAPGVGAERLRGLLDDRVAMAAARELERAKEIGVRFLAIGDEEYPPHLLQLDSPPLVLAVRGALARRDRLALTVVGPRIPSDYGRRMVHRLMPPLAAKGISIVSGCAQGIDAEAHASALATGGRTIAVLGQGLDTPLYPSSNQTLVQRLLNERAGAILSSFPLDARPQPAAYPQRNEILAGLSIAVLVIEAGERSGALITARHAADFGRTVLVCPGDADRPTARGSNALLRDGAALVESSDDVLEALATGLRANMDLLDSDSRERMPGDRSPPPSAGREPETNPGPRGNSSGGADDQLGVHLRMLLKDEHRPLDYLLQQCAIAGFRHSAVVQRLLEMELKGVVRQLPGRVYTGNL